MIWVAWRQFRAQALAAAAVLAAAALYFLVTGLSMHHTYAADLASCPVQNDCADLLRRFQDGYNTAFNLLQLAVVAAPGLIGIFWGAPLIGRELETGTYQLAWNQSVTRTRWLAVKLAGVGAGSAAVAGLLGYLLTWWAAPLDQLTGSRFAAATFATRDIVPLGYAAFAFALGTTAGLLIRRTVPAMAVTLAVFIGLQILVPAAVRPHLLPPTTATVPVTRSTVSKIDGIDISGAGAQVSLEGLQAPQGAWILSTTPLEDSSGRVVSVASHPDCFPDFPPTPSDFSKIGPGQMIDCLARYDLHQSTTYQPASRYWPLQWLETGIYLVLAGALSGFCFWWIRRRRT